MTAAPVMASSLTFVGDLVAPEWGVPHLKAFKAWLGDSVLVANLEGPIVADFSKARPSSTVKFNLASSARVLDALPPASATICTIANNHYEDFAEIVPPQRLRPDLGMIGDRDGTPLLCTVGGKEAVLIGVAFPATDPLRWRSLTRVAVERPSRSLRRLEEARRRYPHKLLIAVVHWGYEFSLLPFPADRAWARRAFEAGADLVIGHHPHVIQPVEHFAGKAVAYSLGNFYMPNGDYFGNDLDFEPLCEQGLAIRFDGADLAGFVTVPDYGAGDIAAEPVDVARDPRLVAPFAGLSDHAYCDYFREARRAGRARIPSGLPALAQYSGWGGLREEAFFALQDSRQFARDTLLRLGLRNPYKRPAGGSPKAAR